MVGEIGHFPEIMLLLVIAMLVFGPGKIPELGSALGRGIREFKDATSGLSSSSQPPYQQPLLDQAPTAQAEEQVHAPAQAAAADPHEGSRAG